MCSLTKTCFPNVFAPGALLTLGRCWAEHRCGGLRLVIWRPTESAVALRQPWSCRTQPGSGRGTQGGRARRCGPSRQASGNHSQPSAVASAGFFLPPEPAHLSPAAQPTLEGGPPSFLLPPHWGGLWVRPGWCSRDLTSREGSVTCPNTGVHARPCRAPEGSIRRSGDRSGSEGE